MKAKRALVLGMAAAAAATLLGARNARAGGHGYGHGPVVVVHGGFGFGYPYWGYGPWFYGGWWGPYGFGPGFYGPGIDLNAATIAGVGAIDLNVKPGEAEVWVDGKFVDEAKDLDGGPRYLWLKDGAHHVVIYRGGYASFDEQIEVRAGTARELKVRLEKGASEPPGKRPAL
jgi:hypothetical protein